MSCVDMHCPACGYENDPADWDDELVPGDNVECAECGECFDLADLAGATQPKGER